MCYWKCTVCDSMQGDALEMHRPVTQVKSLGEMAEMLTVLLRYHRLNCTSRLAGARTRG